MFGDNFLATLGTKLGFRGNPAPSPAPTSKSKIGTYVPPTNEMAPRQSASPANVPRISLPTPGPNDFITKLIKATGLENAPVPTLPKPLPPPTPEQVQEAKDNLRHIAQSVPRGSLRFGQSVGQALVNGIAKVSGSSVRAPEVMTPPDTPLGRFFFGTEPVESYQKEYSDIVDAKQKEGIPGYVIKPLAVLSVSGEAAGDLLGFLPEGQARNAILGKESKALITGITAESDAAKIARTLKEANVSAPIAEKYSAQMAAANTEKATTKLMENMAAEQIQKTTEDAAQRLTQLKEEGKTRILTADEMNEQEFLKKNANKPGELFLGYRTPESADLMKAEQGHVPDTMKMDSPEVAQAADHTVERKSFGLKRNTDQFPYALNKKGIDTVYHDTDPQTASRIMFSDQVRSGLNVSTTPELALGQGGKGAVIEFDTRRLEGNKIMKPGADFVEAQSGKYPEYQISRGPFNITPDVKSVTFEKPLSSKGEENIFGRRQDWKETKETLPDGRVKYTNPRYTSESEPISKIADSEGKVIYDAKSPESEPKFDGGETPATPKKISAYNDFRQKLANKWTKIVENFQNNKNRVEKLVNSPEAKVTESSDPALAHVLYSGRLDTRMRAVQKELTDVVESTVQKAKEAKVDYQAFKDDVNDYLHSQHAPERNAALGEGAAGITDAQAAEMQAALKAKPHFAQVKEVADKLLEMNKKTLDILYQNGADYGVIDKETYDLLRETYKNHVPLNRIFDEDMNISDALTGKGFDVRGSGLKRAKGSAREVADIYTNVTSSLASAVQRVEKNIVDNATYQFVKNNEEMGFGHVMNRPPSYAADPSVLQLRVAGKDKYIKFTDQALADQFKAVGNEHLPTMLKFIENFTRFYSGVATRFNPEFVLSNKFRDLQEAMVFAGAEGKLNKASSLKVLGREAKFQNEKAILDHMRGVDSAGARAYQEMLDNGGATGGMALSTRKQVETTLEDIEKLAQSKPKQAMQATLGKIDQANEIFENSTRLSIYREARAQGMSEKAAAQLAKESTVNFNRKGKWGSVINSLYMFSNASIQGSAKMIKAMKNPKVLAATAATVGSAVFISNKHNDNVDPDWRDKVNKFDRDSNMVIVLQGGDGKKFKYITVPVSYALKPFKVAFDGAYDLSSGAKGAEPKDVLESTVASVINGYNPVGGTDLGSALTPTIADVPREIGVNKKWTGSKIYPDADADLPDSRKYFDSLKDTPLGRKSIALTKFLSDHHIAEWSPANVAYAIQQYAGGTGQFGGKVFDTMMNSVKGDSTPPSDVPFVSRFYKSVDKDEVASRQDQSGNDAQTIKDIRSEGAKQNFDKKQDLKSVIEDIKSGKTPAERTKTFNDFISAHPDQAQALIDEAKKEGKSYKQTQIESLQIKNGERAKFIFQKMNSITDKAEKKKFFDDLVASGLMTPEVIQQIGQMKK